MLRDKEADPSSILFFILGIAIAVGAFFTITSFSPSARSTQFAGRGDRLVHMTQLDRAQDDIVRNSRSM